MNLMMILVSNPTQTSLLLLKGSGMRNHKSSHGHTADDCADQALKVFFEDFAVDHKMQPRPNSTVRPNQKSLTGGMMPMLTHAGFIDVVSAEILHDLPTACGYVNRIAQHYQFGSAWGEFPQSMLPTSVPQDLLARAEAVSQASNARAEAHARTRIRANAAKLALESMGEENALRLLDPPGTRYTYY